MSRFSLPTLDIPNLASKLPEPLRHPAGMALQSLSDLFGAEDPQAAMPVPPVMSMAKSPGGRRVTQAIADKLAEVKNPEALSEIERYGKMYSEAKKAGDPVLLKQLGKRLAELHRIGTGGVAYTPSKPAERIISNPMVDIGAESEVIRKGRYEKRMKHALESLKQTGKKR